MKFDAVNAQIAGRSGRLDAKFHTSPGRLVAERIAKVRSRGVPARKLGGKDGIAKIWQPNRFKRAYAAAFEEKLPYLRPYDVFEYMPVAADWLSVSRNRAIAKYVLKRGTILQSCSGRNLGPAVFVDAYLAKFLVGDDMIRIEIEDESLRYYVLAFLQSTSGQHILRQGKTGSVIDHLSMEHVAGIQIQMLPGEVVQAASSAVKRSIVLREEARLVLDATFIRYERQLPSPDRKRPLKRGWTTTCQQIGTRLDPAYHDPLVTEVREQLNACGGVPVRSVADVQKPAGRYKTRYVGESFGLPILSGSQLLQFRPINLKFMPPEAFDDVSKYALRTKWIAYQADGRAEEGLGLPVMITSDRDGWLASGHVGRLIPKPGIRAGWLFLALKTWQAQIQIKSQASGSVVDSTFRQDMEEVILPPPLPGIDFNGVESAWEKFAEAHQAEEKAIDLINTAFGT